MPGNGRVRYSGERERHWNWLFDSRIEPFTARQVQCRVANTSASVETDENSLLRFWWKVSCRYSQHGGVLRQYHSAECHCARSCRGSHVMEAGGYRAPANPVFFLSTFIVKFQYIATVVGVGTCQEHHRAVERCSCTSPTAVCSSGACNVHHSRCDAPSVGRCRTASVCECSC